MHRMTEEQRAAVGDPLDPISRARLGSEREEILLLAGPGAGKTFVISHRVAKLITSGAFRGDQIVAITYTSSMAARLREGIEELLPESVSCGFCSGSGLVEMATAVCGECSSGRVLVSPPLIGTMHGIAAKLIRSALQGEIAGRFELLALGWFQGEGAFGIAIPEDVADLTDAVYVQAKRRKVKKRDLKAGLRLRGAELEGWPIEASVRQELVRRSLLTYDDLLICLDTIAAVKSDSILPTIGQVYPCLILDEAQDLTRLHWLILENWNPESIFAAGDDAQEIFGFLARRLEQPDTGTFRERIANTSIWGDGPFTLGMNHRAGEQLTAICSVLREALAADGFASSLPLTPGGKESERASPFALYRCEEIDEGGILGAADAVSELLFAGFAEEEIVAIARSWAELEQLAARLEQLEIPFALPKRSRARWKTIAGRAFLAMARHSECGLIDELGAKVILDSLGVGTTAKVAERCSFVALQKGISMAEALDNDRDASLLTPAGWWQACGSSSELLELLELSIRVGIHTGPALAEAASEACDWKGGGWPPGDWLVWLASPENASTVEFEPGKIALTTIHGAKGLEWPGVVLLGACEGSLPGPRDKNEEERGESARALYVGMTRAKEALRVIIPQTLRGKPRNPSPWLTASGIAPIQ